MTKSLSPNQSSPVVNIEDFSWIAGNWQGQALGGTVQEIWSTPEGGSMMGSFRLLKENQVQFYELCILREYQGSVILQIKHFDNKLIGWEERDISEDFALVELSENVAYFDGLTFERIDEDNLNIYVLFDSKGEKEVKFSYFRN